MKIPSISSLFRIKTRDAGRLAVGLTARGIYLAQVEFGGAKPKVLRCEYRETGVLSAAQLEHVAREASLGKAVCTVLLAPGEYRMMLVNAPSVPDDELKAAVRWQIKDGLSYSIDDATVDVLKIPADKNRSDRSRSLYAITAANDTLRKYVDLFDQAGLALGVIEIPETAQRNIAALFEHKDRALALLAFDEKGGLLTFTAEGELYMSRRIEISVSQLSDANVALREQYRDRVELELQRSLDYFERQFSHLTLSRVLLCAPRQSGLQEFLAATLGVPVEDVDLSEVMEIEQSCADFACRALPALGAALRQEIRAT